MKQRITATDFQQLSQKGRDKLFEWMSDKGYWHNSLDRMEYLPNLGQMVEFLDEHETMTLQKRRKRWWVHRYYSYRGKLKRMLRKTELADSLWEAVKEILEG